MKSLIKMIISNLIFLSMLSNSFAATSFDNERLSSIKNLLIKRHYQMKDMPQLLEKYDQNKAKELQNYLLAHPDFRNVIFPTMTIEKGQLVFFYNKEKYLISYNKINNSIIVCWN
jgi:hypothetical protein